MVIGLDGGTWAAFDPLIDKGHMPFLADLKERSSYGVLNSTIPPFTMPAWSTFATGQNPGNHGVFSFFRHNVNGYNLDNVGEFVNSRILGPATLWNLLSKNQRKLVVVNVPLTYPPQPINGIMITGMLTPPQAENFTYPESLKAQLLDYQIDLDNIRGKNRLHIDESMNRIDMLTKLIEMLENRKKTCLRLLSSHPYDFFMVVFTSTDRLFHYFWDFVSDDDDLLSKKYSEEEITVLRKKLIDYLLTLDNAIKEMVEKASDETNVFIMSDHGFGASPSRLFNVNCWLKQQGLLFERSGGSEAFHPLSWIIRFGKSRFVRSITPGLIERRFKSAIKGKFEHLIDWKRTKAYYEPMYMNIGGITVNEAGKKREGHVMPSVKKELLKKITNELMKVEDPRQGHKVVQKVMRGEEVFRGERSPVFPDIVFFADTDYSCGNSLVETEIARDNPQPQRPGDHRVEGMYLAFGPDIRNEVSDESLDIVDLAPTFLYLLDVPLIDRFDGQLMTKLLREDTLLQRKPVVNTFKVHKEDQDYTFDEDEDTALRERLKNLGYL